MDKDLQQLIGDMRKEMGRWPTETEIELFIFGTDQDRKAIIANKDVKQEARDCVRTLPCAYPAECHAEKRCLWR